MATASSSAQFRFAPLKVDCKDFNLDGPLWKNGIVEIDLGQLTSTLAKLIESLQSEIECRAELETKVEIIGARMDGMNNSPPAHTELPVDGLSSSDESSSTITHGLPDLQGVQRRMGNLERELLYYKRQQQEKNVAGSEVLKLQLDTMQRGIDSCLLRDEVPKHTEALLTYVKNLINDEGRAAAKAAAREDVHKLQQSVENMHNTVDNRMGLIDERLDDLSAKILAAELAAAGASVSTAAAASRLDELERAAAHDLSEGDFKNSHNKHPHNAAQEDSCALSPRSMPSTGVPETDMLDIGPESLSLPESRVNSRRGSASDEHALSSDRRIDNLQEEMAKLAANVKDVASRMCQLPGGDFDKRIENLQEEMGKLAGNVKDIQMASKKCQPLGDQGHGDSDKPIESLKEEMRELASNVKDMASRMCQVPAVAQQETDLEREQSADSLADINSSAQDREKLHSDLVELISGLKNDLEHDLHGRFIELASQIQRESKQTDGCGSDLLLLKDSLHDELAKVIGRLEHIEEKVQEPKQTQRFSRNFISDVEGNLKEILRRLTDLESTQSFPERDQSKENPCPVNPSDVERRMCTLETQLKSVQASLSSALAGGLRKTEGNSLNVRDRSGKMEPSMKRSDEDSQQVSPHDLARAQDLADLKERIERLELSLRNAGEFANVFQAVRGVQRDLEMNADKLVDFGSRLAALQSQVDAAFPEFFRIFEQFVNGCESQPDSDNSRGDASDGFGSLREAFGGPYVSLQAQELMKEAIERTLNDFQSEMEQLRIQLRDDLAGKASSEDLKKIIGQQQAIETSLRRLMQAQSPVMSKYDEATTEDPACMKVPLLPARCISCDRKVEFTGGKPHPCHGSCPSWPVREPACPVHQAAGPPPGYKQRRRQSLPAIQR
jgi:uncharacterized protein (UPF0335 family)